MKRLFLTLGCLWMLAACSGGNGSNGNPTIVIPPTAVPKTATTPRPTPVPTSSSVPTPLASASAAPPATAVPTTTVPSPVTPTPTPTQAPTSFTTVSCVTASSDQDEFPLPTFAGVTALKSLGATCVRLPIGLSASENKQFLKELTAWNAAGFDVMGIAAYPEVPPASVLKSTMKWMEIGNELDVYFENEGQVISIPQAIAWEQSVSRAARVFNHALYLISAGSSGDDSSAGFPWIAATAPALLPYVDCLGVHFYNIEPSSFGNYIQQFSAIYHAPVCMTEYRPNNAGDWATIQAVSAGKTPILALYNLPIIEAWGL